MINRDAVIKKIMDMPKEQVAKVLIFMAGMEAEHCINQQNGINQQNEAEQVRNSAKQPE